uniref:Uncharacterized protein n=1 Tax=Oryza punctata TaxID=4537 RepID=A0A0E0M131_ORYPU
MHDEEALALSVAGAEEELTLLDDGAGAAVGECSCDTTCKTCLVKCGIKCFHFGFPDCFINCAFTTDKCFG